MVSKIEGRTDCRWTHTLPKALLPCFWFHLRVCEWMKDKTRQKEQPPVREIQTHGDLKGFVCVRVCEHVCEREWERGRGLSELLNSVLFHLVICCLSVWCELWKQTERHTTHNKTTDADTHTRTHRVKEFERLQRVASELYAMCKPNKTCQTHRAERWEGEIISADFRQMGIKKVILYV